MKIFQSLHRVLSSESAELLGSDFMRDFLNGISKDFDYIIIDTPPLNVVSDALPLIRESDGIVLVVRDNQTTHPNFKRHFRLLNLLMQRFWDLLLILLNLRQVRVTALLMILIITAALVLTEDTAITATANITAAVMNTAVTTRDTKVKV